MKFPPDAYVRGSTDRPAFDGWRTDQFVKAEDAIVPEGMERVSDLVAIRPSGEVWAFIEVLQFWILKAGWTYGKQDQDH